MSGCVESTLWMASESVRVAQVSRHINSKMFEMFEMFEQLKASNADQERSRQYRNPG